MYSCSCTRSCNRVSDYNSDGNNRPVSLIKGTGIVTVVVVTGTRLGNMKQTRHMHASDVESAERSSDFETGKILWPLVFGLGRSVQKEGLLFSQLSQLTSPPNPAQALTPQRACCYNTRKATGRLQRYLQDPITTAIVMVLLLF